jgi:hypothetical protein
MPLGGGAGEGGEGGEGDWPYFVPHARDYEGFKKKSFKGANLFGFWVV